VLRKKRPKHVEERKKYKNIFYELKLSISDDVLNKTQSEIVNTNNKEKQRSSSEILISFFWGVIIYIARTLLKQLKL